MTPRLRVDLERDTFAPGDAVRGRLRVTAGGRCRQLLLCLQLREETADYSRVVRRVPGAVLHEGDLVTGAAHAFAVALPADAPPSFCSAHGRLWWELEIWSDPTRSIGRKEFRVEVTRPVPAPGDGGATSGP